jgi:hypothetical protein
MFAFTDECQMQVGPFKHALVWREQGEDPPQPQLLQPRFAKLSQCMVWGLICGKDILYFFVFTYYITIHKIIFRAMASHFLAPALGEDNEGSSYIDHILPILDDFFEQNPEKMLIEDNATPHSATDPFIPYRSCGTRLRNHAPASFLFSSAVDLVQMLNLRYITGRLVFAVIVVPTRHSFC